MVTAMCKNKGRKVRGVLIILLHHDVIKGGEAVDGTENWCLVTGAGDENSEINLALGIKTGGERCGGELQH